MADRVCIPQYESGYRKSTRWLYLVSNLDKYKVVFSSNGSAQISRADKSDLDCVSTKDRLDTVATHRRDLTTGLYSAVRSTHNPKNERDIHALQLKMFRGNSRSLLLITKHMRCPECRPTNVVIYSNAASTVAIGDHTFTLKEGDFIFVSAMDFFPVQCDGDFKVYV